jgi:hypothetical protein
MAAPLYPGIGEIGGPIGDPPKTPVSLDQETTALRERAERAEAETAEVNKALRESVAARRPAPVAVAPTPPTDPGKMPDPSIDPSGFETWTSARRARDDWDRDQKAEKQRLEKEGQAASARILDQYIATNPQYAPIRTQVFEYFREAVAELGLAELPDDPSTLNRVVDAKVTALKQAVAPAKVDPKVDPKADPGEVLPEDGDAPLRTGGLSGGSHGTPAGGTPPKEDDGVEIKSLVDVMLDRQAKSDLF